MHIALTDCATAVEKLFGFIITRIIESRDMIESARLLSCVSESELKCPPAVILDMETSLSSLAADFYSKSTESGTVLMSSRNASLSAVAIESQQRSRNWL